MSENKPQNKPSLVRLDIQIFTNEYTRYAGSQDDVLAQICHTGYFIDALQWFTATLAQVADDIDSWEKPTLPEYFDLEFRRNSLFMSQIVNGLATNLSELVSDLHHNQLKQAKETTEKEQASVLDLSEHITPEDSCIDIAKNLSTVLNSPQIPNSLKVAIANGLNDLTVNDDELINIMDSPKYIAKVLCGQKLGGE